jgi:hypothetical protein
MGPRWIAPAILMVAIRQEARDWLDREQANSTSRSASNADLLANLQRRNRFSADLSGIARMHHSLEVGGMGWRCLPCAQSR